MAKAVSVQGGVELQQAGRSQWEPVNLNDTFCPGDKIRVHDRSRADLALVNQPVMRLDENTTVTLGGVKQERSLVEMLKGAAHFFSRAPKSLQVVTAFVNAGVEGTEFYVRADEDRTFLSIFEGKVLAENAQGSLALTSGQAAVAEAGKAPVLKTVVRPRDAVQWALYYPPVLQEAPTAEDENDPRYLAHQASLLLSVGRVDQASAGLERALRLEPNYSDALALQSIVAVVQNDKEKALSLAQKAVEADPNSATAHLSMSYAQQARFDLDGALSSLQTAVKAAPENALAWARLAEIWSAKGYLDRSLQAAQKAVELDPSLSRTQTVLGFAHLTRVETEEAKAAFEKAIRFDPADPLPRLGLGLAKIREGDLDEGGREIEIAASLNPNDALVRSYLGKVYFEQKRGKLDTREFDIAKEIDPNDPTPWFYGAIAKQTTNRPVEALQDLQKAKELNDNRAVYRSKLQLDSDLAARSASIARVYNDLGFQQRGLFEGWMSVNTDPSNYSAHRFLADTYAALPRQEIARVSELLQSQLLQPINITPIQPSLAESNLYLISTTQGPSGSSFREFNPLFNRNQAAVQANVIAGGNSTVAAEGIVSGVYGKTSLSAGFNHFETDGWRENADQEDDIANVFAQVELTPKTSIQGEFRSRNNDRGDTTLRFFEDDYDPSLEQKDKVDNIRIGFRQELSPQSNLIGNFSHQTGNRDYSSVETVILPPPFPGPPPIVYQRTTVRSLDEESYGGELQYLFRSERVNIVTGGGYFDIDNEWERSLTASLPFIPPTLSEENEDIQHQNLYLYSYINLLENINVTLGASGDFYDRDVEENSAAGQDEDLLNPKFGVIWKPFPNTAIRGAAFRTFKRTLLTDQTLEPTNVAGFNQFYDDPNAAEAWVYGGALDQKFTTSIYGGVEIGKRELDAPYLINGNWMTAEGDENLGRAYLYWTPHRWVALTAGYQYEKIEWDEVAFDGIKEVETHRVPLGINLFHPSGLSVSLKTTYFDQEGDFQRQDAGLGAFTHGEDQFWTVDAAINYRLPNRNGFVTFGATNLFDESFEFVDTDIDNPQVQPDRVIYGKVTIALP